MDVELQKFTKNGTALFNGNGEIVDNEKSIETAESQVQDNKTVVETQLADLESEWARKWGVIKCRIKRSLLIFLGIVYFCYFFYAMYCELGDEGSIRLLVSTVFGVLYLSTVFLLKYEKVNQGYKSILGRISKIYSSGKTTRIIRWVLYIVFGLGCVAYIVFNVALTSPGKLRSVLGMVVFVLFMVFISNNKRKIKWHTVFWGFVLQFLLGIFVLKTDAGKATLNWASRRLQEFMTYAKSGSIFLFGPKYIDHPFAFTTLPQIITFCAAVQVLVYLGTIPFIVRTFGKLVAFLLDVSAPEAMNASANIFLGGGESSMIIRKYLRDMPQSHLFAIMTNGGASCGGAALIQFMLFGVSPEYLLSASIMSVPAALACAKIIIPDDDDGHTDDGQSDESKKSNNGMKHMVDNENRQRQESFRHQEPSGIIEAIMIGTKIGMALCANLIGIMIVFNAMVDFFDSTVLWFGDRVNVYVTMKIILGYIFYPVAYMMGVDVSDCRKGAELLGIKVVSNPMLGYQPLGELLRNRKTFQEYTASYNSSFWNYNGDDIYLQLWNQTLSGGFVTEQSEVVLTYAMCGFASITSLGGALGAMGALAPNRLNDVSSLAVRSLLGGVIASFLTACVAGLIA